LATRFRLVTKTSDIRYLEQPLRTLFIQHESFGADQN